MKRTTLSLIVAVAVLAVVAGLAAVTRSDGADQPAKETPRATRMPVQRTTLACPAPTSSEFAETTYTAVSVPPADAPAPAGDDADDAEDEGASATLRPADGELPDEGEASGEEDDPNAEDDGAEDDGAKDDERGKKEQKGAADAPEVTLSEPRAAVVADTDDPEAPALVGNASGTLAPGYTVQQTTEISMGEGRGLLGTACAAPSAEFWFAGASTHSARADYVHLTNPDDTPAVVDLELYGADGQIETSSGNGISVPARATVPVRLSTLTSEQETDLVLHVIARSGRLSAAVQAVHADLGGDWLPPSEAPAPSAVLPGLPKDTEAARLVVFAPDDDADLKVELATPTGRVVPAGYETLHVRAGMTASVELKGITQGEPGSLVLTPTESDRPADVVAGVQVVRGEDDEQEIAFLSAVGPVTEQATVAGNERKGTTLFLAAPDRAATVKITSIGPGGGDPQEQTVEVKARTTLAVVPPAPSGKKPFAVTVTPASGGPVYAARMLSRAGEDVAMFTLQPVPDDRATVLVPEAEADISVLGR